MKLAAEEIVQAQLDAYNKRDLDSFCACFSEDVSLINLGEVEPFLKGLDNLREFYVTKRFNLPGLYAKLINRMTVGCTVIDHEEITGLPDIPMMEVAAIYLVEDGKIKCVNFVRP